MFKSLIAASFAVVGSLAAQDCPDQVVKQLPTQIDYTANGEDCSGGFSFEWNGIKLKGPSGRCPSAG